MGQFSNPFDINQANLATLPDLPSSNVDPTADFSKSNPYILLDIQKDTPLDVPNKTPEDKSTSFLSAMSKSAQGKKDDKFNYTYSADKDLRYKNLDYSPYENTEKKYADNQGTLAAYGVQFNRLYDNAVSTFNSHFIGTGRFIIDASNAKFGNDSSFNQPETLAAYLKSINNEMTNPIYNDGTVKSWYSPKGAFGDFIASQGFTVGALAGGLVSGVVGAVEKAAMSNPITGTIMGLGMAALFNNKVRNYLGEENANFLTGLLGEGATSWALSSGISTLTRVIPAKSVPFMQNALRDIKQGEGYSVALGRAAESAIKDIYRGTLLDGTTALTKEIKFANTINKALRTATTGGKMYLSSGAEAGMEAITAQYDYIGGKMKEAQDKGMTLSQDEYNKIWSESLAMSKDVYNINRVLLGITNTIEFGDILTGSFFRNTVKDLNDFITGNAIRHEMSDLGIKVARREIKDGIKTEIKAGIKTEVKAEVKEGIKSEAKAEAKIEIENAVKGETKAEAKESVKVGEEPKAGTVAEPKVEPIVEPKVDPAATPKVEPTLAVNAEDKPMIKPTIKEKIKNFFKGETKKDIAADAEAAGKDVTEKKLESMAETKVGDFEATVINSPWYTLLRHAIIDSSSEGFEEGAQFVISEGNKEYLNKKNENKSKMDSYLFGLKQTLTTSEGWDNIISGLLGGLVSEGIGSVIRGGTAWNRDKSATSFREGFTGFNQRKAEVLAAGLNQLFQRTNEITSSSKELQELLRNPTNETLASFRDKIDAHLYSVAVRGIQSNTFEGTKEYIKDYFSTENENYENLVKLYGSAEAVDKSYQDLTKKIDEAESNYSAFKQFYNNPFTVSKIEEAFASIKNSAFGKKLKLKDTTDTERKEKAELYDDMVDMAARTLYLLKTNQGEAKTTRMQLNGALDNVTFNFEGKEIKINSVFDMSHYFGGVNNSYELLQRDLDTKIDSVNQEVELFKDHKTDHEKSIHKELVDKQKKLEALRKDIFTTNQTVLDNVKLLRERKLNNESVLSEDQSNILQETLNGSAPLLLYLFQKTTFNNTENKLFNDNITNRGAATVDEAKTFNVVKNAYDYKSTLVRLSEIESSLFFLSSDLKKFTSEKEQKLFIEYLISQKNKNKLTAAEITKFRLATLSDTSAEEGLLKISKDFDERERYHYGIVLHKWAQNAIVVYNSRDGKGNPPQALLTLVNGEWYIGDEDLDTVLKKADSIKLIKKDVLDANGVSTNNPTNIQPNPNAKNEVVSDDEINAFAEKFKPGVAPAFTAEELQFQANNSVRIQARLVELQKQAQGGSVQVDPEEEDPAQANSQNPVSKATTQQTTGPVDPNTLINSPEVIDKIYETIKPILDTLDPVNTRVDQDPIHYEEVAKLPLGAVNVNLIQSSEHLKGLLDNNPAYGNNKVKEAVFEALKKVLIEQHDSFTDGENPTKIHFKGSGITIDNLQKLAYRLSINDKTNEAEIKSVLNVSEESAKELEQILNDSIKELKDKKGIVSTQSLITKIKDKQSAEDRSKDEKSLNEEEPISSLSEVDNFKTRRDDNIESIFTVKNDLTVIEKIGITYEKSYNVIIFINPKVNNNSTLLIKWFLYKKIGDKYERVTSNKDINQSDDFIVLLFPSYSAYTKANYTKAEIEKFTTDSKNNTNSNSVNVLTKDSVSIIPRIGYKPYSYSLDKKGDLLRESLGDKVTVINLKKEIKNKANPVTPAKVTKVPKKINNSVEVKDTAKKTKKLETVNPLSISAKSYFLIDSKSLDNNNQDSDKIVQSVIKIKSNKKGTVVYNFLENGIDGPDQIADISVLQSLIKSKSTEAAYQFNAPSLTDDNLFVDGCV